MKILICDDEIHYLNDLKIHVHEYMCNRFIEHEIVTATSASQLAGQDIRFDLAFLDIQMDDTDGITLAKELQKYNSKITIFFVTNFDEYLDDAMDLQAFRFFSKPFQVSRLYSGLDKAMEYIDGAYVDIYVSGAHVQKRILVDDIMYLTRLNRRVILQTKNRAIQVSEDYDTLCEKLPPLFFYAVHKSYFVNLHYIKEYAYSELILTDDTRVPVASRKQAPFHKYWFEYLRRR